MLIRRWLNSQKQKQKDEQTDKGISGRIVRWIDGHIEGQTERQIDWQNSSCKEQYVAMT